jgi:HEAT repeat protein
VLTEVARTDPNEEVRIGATLSIGQVEGENTRPFRTLTRLFHSLPAGRQKQRVYILDAVAETGDEGALRFFVEVARKSDNAGLQSSAVDYIGELCRDQKKCLDLLLDLFNSVPPPSLEARQTILYCAADIGNDRAVEFLSKVARSGSDPQLRSDAVCLLGSIGGDKAKTALYDILVGR